MPIATAPQDVPQPAGVVTAVVAAQPGWIVAVGPIKGPIVAWAQITDDTAPGGVRVDPVFIAGGRTWTPDQYRASVGGEPTFTITQP